MPTKSPKHATPEHPILDLLAQRWSPYVFEPRSVERGKLLACLEAARWAASSFNEQPWYFILAAREDEERFATMLQCLVEANQTWAVNAGALLINVAKQTFSRNGKPNRVAKHDIALAAANFTIQATSEGLAVHQMAGLDLDKARQTYGIPQGYDPMTAIAIGYAPDPDRIREHAPDPSLVERDQGPRSRKPLSEFVFADRWENAAPQVSAGS